MELVDCLIKIRARAAMLTPAYRTQLDAHNVAAVLQSMGFSAGNELSECLRNASPNAVVALLIEEKWREKGVSGITAQDIEKALNSI